MDALPSVPPASTVSRWWTDSRASLPAAIGLVLIASGCIYGLMWAVVGGSWEGPVSLRKPILFGISGGLTLLSLGWAWAQLPWRRGDRWLAGSLAVALLIEVVAIDYQQWRGVPSHFNRQTPFDSFLYDALGLLILWVTLIAVDLMIRFFWQKTSLPADMLLAARGGLVLLVVSCLLGIWVSVLGELRQQAGLEPERFGLAGVPKFPHGAVIHALQWLPLFAWAARLAGLPEQARLRLVASATLGTLLMGIFALAQTLLGRSRWDTTPATLLLLIVGLLLLAAPAVAIGVAIVKKVPATKSREAGGNRHGLGL